MRKTGEMSPKSNSHHLWYHRREFEAYPDLRELRRSHSQIVPQMDYRAHNILLHREMDGMALPHGKGLIGLLLDVATTQTEFSLENMQVMINELNGLAESTGSFAESDSALRVAEHLWRQMGFIALTPKQITAHMGVASGA
jgi:hypothetical protein